MSELRFRTYDPESLIDESTALLRAVSDALAVLAGAPDTDRRIQLAAHRFSAPLSTTERQEAVQILDQARRRFSRNVLHLSR